MSSHATILTSLGCTCKWINRKQMNGMEFAEWEFVKLCAKIVYIIYIVVWFLARAKNIPLLLSVITGSGTHQHKDSLSSICFTNTFSVDALSVSTTITRDEVCRLRSNLLYICTVMHRIMTFRSRTDCMYDSGPIRL